MAERGIARIVLSGSSHSEHETDTELEMKTRKTSSRTARRSNSENRCVRVCAWLFSVSRRAYALLRCCLRDAKSHVRTPALHGLSAFLHVL